MNPLDERKLRLRSEAKETSESSGDLPDPQENTAEQPESWEDALRRARTCPACGDQNPRIVTKTGEMVAHCACGAKWPIAPAPNVEVPPPPGRGIGKQVFVSQYGPGSLVRRN